MSSSSNITSILLRFPPEIRNQIYRELRKHRLVYNPFPGTAITSACYSFWAAILSTNKQLNRECSDIFYNENTWKIRITWEYNYYRSGPALGGLEASPYFRCLRNLELEFIMSGSILITYPSLGLKRYCDLMLQEVEHVCKTLARAPDLQRIEIAWRDLMKEGDWEDKKMILEPLNLLREKVAFYVGDVYTECAERQLSREVFAQRLSEILVADIQCYSANSRTISVQGPSVRIVA
ncbi:MAG: hypothetical protein M1827_006453 [Pycnora praestabilis]|nr:MAG: hypothetical protein M1827_006453 [Pycnora praestabilis]